MVIREVKELVVYGPPELTEEDFKIEFKQRNIDIVSIKKDIPIFVDKALEKHGYIPYLVKVIQL
jgi:hypothetical protein